MRERPTIPRLDALRRCNIGSRNAAVLPDPVCAEAHTSRPRKIAGIAAV